MSESPELEPWQKQVIEKFKGKGALQITGRNSGKSYLNGSVAYKRLFDDIFNRPVEALICDTGTVYGRRYFTVQVDGGTWFEMENWCHETFGESSASSIWCEEKPPQPSDRWYVNNRKFWFRDERDRDWFVLRWNS